MTDARRVGEFDYRCVVGHEIVPGELDRQTIVTSLDGGAQVRICREHGAPIALRSRPGRNPDESQ